MYQVGDYVVKANNGVCRIDQIMHLDLPNVSRDKLYYLMIPQEDKNMKLYVPVDGKGDELRSVITEDEAWELIQKIPDIEATWIVNDKLREQEYKDAIRSCRPELLVGIIKNIYHRKKVRNEQGKKNTAVDERYFKIAENTLYSELAFAVGKKKDEMQELIATTIEAKAKG